MNDPIHLVIVTPLPPAKSSIGQYGYYLAEALARSNKFNRVTVLAQTESNIHHTDEQRLFRVERLWDQGRLDSSLKIINRLIQIKPDLVWYNFGASIFGKNILSNVGGLLCPLLTRIVGLRSVLTMHEMIDAVDFKTLNVSGGAFLAWGTNIIRSIMSQADIVCVTLDCHAKWLLARNKNTRVMHIPHGIFSAPQMFQDAPDTELLVFGNLAPYKGLEILLQAFYRLHLQYPFLRLTVAGTEHPRFPQYVEQIKKDAGDHPAIKWMLNIPEHELPQLFARSTIVVIPNTATTGSSSVLYRALGWGRAVIASDLPELRAVAEEERFWINFFPCGDTVALAKSLESLLFDSGKRKAQTLHNFSIILDHLTLQHTCQAYLHAFECALAS